MGHGPKAGVSAAQGYRVEISAHQSRAIIAAVVLLALVGALAVSLDWREVRGVIAAAHWRPILVALAITAVSLLCQAHSFALVNR